MLFSFRSSSGGKRYHIIIRTLQTDTVRQEVWRCKKYVHSMTRLPECDVMRRVLLSRVWTGFLKPHKASTSCSSNGITRSSPFLMTRTRGTSWGVEVILLCRCVTRGSMPLTEPEDTWRQRRRYHLVKYGCSRWSRTMMMSPGSIPGSWSPSPWNTIFWPSLIPEAVQWPHVTFGFLVPPSVSHRWMNTDSPLSMWTSKIFFWRRILRPPQALQRSLWLILCPWPWQLWHIVDTCWTIPGTSWCMRTCTPVPWQVMHICAAPLRLPRPAEQNEPSADEAIIWAVGIRTGSRLQDGFILLLDKEPVHGLRVLNSLLGLQTLTRACQKQLRASSRRTFTPLTNSILLESQFSCSSVVKIFQRHRNLVNNILTCEKTNQISDWGVSSS